MSNSLNKKELEAWSNFLQILEGKLPAFSAAWAKDLEPALPLFEESENENFKGYPEFVDWIENKEIFNQISKNDFGRVIDAEQEYSKPDFQGKCKLILKSIIVNGKKNNIR